MSYYRLRDIKTPPFAYVVNKEDVVKSCHLCQMPFGELDNRLEVEICATGSENWEKRILGKPLMADHWLIGDEQFAQKIEEILPEQFETLPISVVSWMTRSPMDIFAQPSEILKKTTSKTSPKYFYFRPTTQMGLSPELLDSFPPIRCCECEREIPELPIDFQPTPDPNCSETKVASLKGLYLEGYDYLFRQDIIEEIEQLFPGMILEKLLPEPMAI